MSVKICSSVVAGTLREVKRMVNKAEKDGADIIEIRLDYAQEQFSLKKIRKFTDVPLIATIRPLREGGLFRGSEEARIRQLFSAAESDFDLIDIELSTEDSEDVVRRLTATGVGTIISSHFSDSHYNMLMLNSIFNQELKTHADICKIIISAREFEDNLTCLRFLEQASKKTSVTCFSMGELGLMSRLLSPLFGGYLTYASVEKSKEAASGQLTVAEMRRFYEVLGV